LLPSHRILIKHLKNNSPFKVEDQVVSIYAATNGFLDELPESDVGAYEKGLLEFVKQKYPQILKGIVEKKELTKDNEQTLKDALIEFKSIFQPSNKK